MIEVVLDQLEQHFSHDWLLRVEMMEILCARELLPHLQKRILDQLQEIMGSDSEAGQFDPKWVEIDLCIDQISVEQNSSSRRARVDQAV